MGISRDVITSALAILHISMSISPIFLSAFFTVYASQLSPSTPALGGRGTAKTVHCNAKKQGTRRPLACWSGFSSRNATVSYDHLRLSVFSLFFNAQSVNINQGILPQMIRVEMKHPSWPAESTAGRLSGSVSCLPWHENFRLARQAGSGSLWGPVRQTRFVLSCQPPGCPRAMASSLFGGCLHLHSPAAPRPAGVTTGQPLSVPGRNRSRLRAALGAPQLSRPHLPKTVLQWRRLPPQERYPNRVTPPLQLICRWRQSLYTLVHVYGFLEHACSQTDV